MVRFQISLGLFTTPLTKIKGMENGIPPTAQRAMECVPIPSNELGQTGCTSVSDVLLVALVVLLLATTSRVIVSASTSYY